MHPTEPATLQYHFLDSDLRAHLNLKKSSQPIPDALAGPIEIFVNSINSSQTRRQYKRKIETFLDSLDLGAGSATTSEEKAAYFVQQAAKDPSWAIACVERVVAQQKQRYYAKEISAGTIRNYYKPIKSFCEANDIELKWK